MGGGGERVAEDPLDVADETKGSCAQGLRNDDEIDESEKLRAAEGAAARPFA